MKNSVLFLILFIVLCSFNVIKNDDAHIVSYNIVMKLDTVNRKIEIQTVLQIEKPDTSPVINLLFSDVVKITEAKQYFNQILFS